METREPIEIPEPKLSRFIFSDTRFSWVWLLLRLYVGYEWLSASWEKVTSAAWVGPQAGSALQGFLQGSLQQASGPHPAVSSWYVYFINNAVLIHPIFFSYLISYGEFAVGIGLVLGAFTGIAAFFGILMNLNYLFAGAVSINPLLLIIELFLVLAWRNAGWLGLDHVLLPYLGTPWQGGKLFRGEVELSPVEVLLLVMGAGLVALVALSLLFR
jgi:thiosulfate dehydrogenase [quinone] large subunit